MPNGQMSVRCFQVRDMQHKVGSLGPAYITFHKYPIDHKGGCIISLPGILHISAALLTQPLGLLNSMDPSFEVWSMQRPAYMIIWSGCLLTLCKKESQVKSKKMAFSQGKSTKSQKILTFCWFFLTKSHFFWLYMTFFFTEPDMSSSVLLIWRELRDQADRACKFMTYSQWW